MYIDRKWILTQWHVYTDIQSTCIHTESKKLNFYNAVNTHTHKYNIYQCQKSSETNKYYKLSSLKMILSINFDKTFHASYMYDKKLHNLSWHNTGTWPYIFLIIKS